MMTVPNARAERGAIDDALRLPLPYRDRPIFLSAYWQDASDFPSWCPDGPPFALRALAYPMAPSEVRIVMQFIDERTGISDECIAIWGESPQKAAHMGQQILNRLEGPLETRFPKRVIDYERAALLEGEQARLMTLDGRLPEGGVHEIEISVLGPVSIFPRLSNHHMLALTHHPVIEFYKCPQDV